MLSARGAVHVALLAAVALSGCSWRAQAIARADLSPVRAVGLSEAFEAHEQAARALASLRGSGHLQVRDLRLGRQREFGMRLACARGGRLYLKANVAVVTALEATSDGRRFWLSVPSKRKVWTGDATRPAHVAAPDTQDLEGLRPADLVAALLPEPLAPAPDEALLFEGERQTVSLAVGRPDAQGRASVRRRVWLDRATLHLLRARTYDSAGSLELEATFGDWRAGLPWRVGVAREGQGYEAVLTFDKAEANVALPERAFEPRLPEDYEVVRLDEH